VECAVGIRNPALISRNAVAREQPRYTMTFAAESCSLYRGTVFFFFCARSTIALQPPARLHLFVTDRVSEPVPGSHPMI
jgi:hypothetical protein